MLHESTNAGKIASPDLPRSSQPKSPLYRISCSEEFPFFTMGKVLKFFPQNNLAKLAQSCPHWGQKFNLTHFYIFYWASTCTSTVLPVHMSMILGLTFILRVGCVNLDHQIMIFASEISLDGELRCQHTYLLSENFLHSACRTAIQISPTNTVPIRNSLSLGLLVRRSTECVPWFRYHWQDIISETTLRTRQIYEA